MFGSFITRLEHLFVASVLFLSVCMSFYSLQLLLACKPGVNEPPCTHNLVSVNILCILYLIPLSGWQLGRVERVVAV